MSSSGCSSILANAWRRIFADSLALLDAHEEAVPAVAHGAELAAADGHVELELGVDRVAVVLAQIPLHARAAEVGADEAPVHRLGAGDDGDVGEALDVDVVHRDEAIELAPSSGSNLSTQVITLSAQPFGHVERDAADAVVVVREARAAELLDEVVDVLALAERPHEGRGRADVHRHRAERDHVAGDAVELARDDAQVLGALAAPRCP